MCCWANRSLDREVIGSPGSSSVHDAPLPYVPPRAALHGTVAADRAAIDTTIPHHVCSFGTGIGTLIMEHVRRIGMAGIEEVEAAVLEQLSEAEEQLPKAIMDRLQQRPEVTRAQVSEAIWRLVASRRVQLTKSLHLRADGITTRTSS